MVLLYFTKAAVAHWLPYCSDIREVVGSSPLSGKSESRSVAICLYIPSMAGVSLLGRHTQLGA